MEGRQRKMQRGGKESSSNSCWRQSGRISVCSTRVRNGIYKSRGDRLLKYEPENYSCHVSYVIKVGFSELAKLDTFLVIIDQEVVVGWCTSLINHNTFGVKVIAKKLCTCRPACLCIRTKKWFDLNCWCAGQRDVHPWLAEGAETGGEGSMWGQGSFEIMIIM